MSSLDLDETSRFIWIHFIAIFGSFKFCLLGFSKLEQKSLRFNLFFEDQPNLLGLEQHDGVFRLTYHFKSSLKYNLLHVIVLSHAIGLLVHACFQQSTWIYYTAQSEIGYSTTTKIIIENGMKGLSFQLKSNFYVLLFVIYLLFRLFRITQWIDQINSWLY